MPSSASATVPTYPLSLHDALPICSNRGIAAQLVDDDRGHTLACVAWTEGDLAKLKGMERSQRAGALLGERAKAAGVETAVSLARSRSEEHTSELQSRVDLVCRLLLRRQSRPTLFPYTTLFRSAPIAASPPSSWTTIAATRWPASPGRRETSPS